MVLLGSSEAGTRLNVMTMAHVQTRIQVSVEHFCKREHRLHVSQIPGVPRIHF
jgi:hypothetical protein